jgi:hypothetical protein
MENPADYANYFRLLEHTGGKKASFNLPVHVRGYNCTMHYMASMIKVCMMALEGKDMAGSPYIPEPGVNIVAVLELLLNMIPYEESELLDLLHAQLLMPGDEEIEAMNIRLIPPAALGIS